MRYGTQKKEKLKTLFIEELNDGGDEKDDDALKPKH